jgi:hypothetical protein
VFVSHTDPRSGVTSTIRVNVVSDLVAAVLFIVGGIGLIIWALVDTPPRQHPTAFVVGVVLWFGGDGLLRATLALIRRAARTYTDAAR